MQFSWNQLSSSHEKFMKCARSRLISNYLLACVDSRGLKKNFKTSRFQTTFGFQILGLRSPRTHMPDVGYLSISLEPTNFMINCANNGYAAVLSI